MLIGLSPRPTTGSGFENQRNHGNAGTAILAKPYETRPVGRRGVILMGFLGTPYLVALGDNQISTVVTLNGIASQFRQTRPDGFAFDAFRDDFKA